MIDIIEMLKRHEGVRHKVYLDSLGIPTVGCGLNLLRSGAKQRLAAHGIDYDGVLKGSVLLTDTQIDDLLKDDISDAVMGAKHMCPDFDTWPDTAKAVLIDLVFNVGATKLATWKHTIGAFNAKNWKSVGDNLAATQPWYSQVGVRAAENVTLMRGIK